MDSQDNLHSIRGVIFDLDGTLGNTLPLCILAFRQAIEPCLRRSVSDDEIMATFGPSEEGTINTLTPDYAAQCLEDYLRCYETQHTLCPEPFPGIPELLMSLQSQGVRLGLVTGKGHRSTEISLRRFQLAEFFEYIETGSPYGPRKAEGIQQVVSQWKVDPDAVVYVGDVPSDILAARKAGTAVVAAAWAETTNVDTLIPLKPDAILTSVEELQNWLAPRLLSS